MKLFIFSAFYFFILYYSTFNFLFSQFFFPFFVHYPFFFFLSLFTDFQRNFFLSTHHSFTKFSRLQILKVFSFFQFFPFIHFFLLLSIYLLFSLHSVSPSESLLSPLCLLISEFSFPQPSYLDLLYIFSFPLKSLVLKAFLVRSFPLIL